VRNVSTLISTDFAEAYLYCHMTAYDGYLYYLEEDSKYAEWVDWLQALLQNMAGNVINLTNMYNKIVVANENEDMELYWYIFGLIFNIMADFEPIDLEELEAYDDGDYEYNQDSNQYAGNPLS